MYHGLTQVTMREEAAGSTLARIASGELSRSVLPWVPLLRGGEEVAIISEWKNLAGQEPDQKRRGEMGGLALVFADLAGRQVVGEQGLEGWNMKQSVVVLGWQREAEVRRMRTVILRSLELRYKTTPPADLANRVGEFEELDELSRWFEATLTSDTLASFRAAVGQPSP